MTPQWRKSTRSTEGTSGECVEVADLALRIGIRDSKDPRGPHLSVTRAGFVDLVTAIKRSV